VGRRGGGGYAESIVHRFILIDLGVTNMMDDNAISTTRLFFFTMYFSGVFFFITYKFNAFIKLCFCRDGWNDSMGHEFKLNSGYKIRAMIIWMTSWCGRTVRINQ